MSGEIYSYLFPKLFSSGAKDVFLTNIMMKKNRPAQKLSVLCSIEKAAEIEKIIYEQTSTLGIRRIEVERSCLKRENKEFASSLGDISLKAAYYKGELLKISPEYEDCARIAEKSGRSIRRVFEIIKSEAEIYYRV